MHTLRETGVILNKIEGFFRSLVRGGKEIDR